MKLKILAFSAVFGLLALGGCGGGGGGDDAGNPPLPPGVYVVDTTGGNGGSTGGTGGDGGAVTVVKEGGAGDVSVLRSGEVDASFAPLAVAVDLGANPLAIAADVTVAFSAAEPPAGTPYLMSFNNPRDNLFISDGDGTLGNEPPVTGISVAAGATLTFLLDETSWAKVILAGDIENHGTMTTVDADATQRGSLEITLRSYVGDGVVTTAAVGAGRNGGSVHIYAAGFIVNSGTIATGGGDNEAGDGGHGGDLELYADDHFENTGSIVSGGGSASGLEGSGGSGGYLDVVGTYGVYNAGDLTCSGGHGYTGGGNGGWVWLEVYTEGDLRNSGRITSSGGDAAAGFAGAGGDMDIYAYGGDLRNTGNLTATGGNATGAGGDGGGGGYFILGVFQGYNVSTPPGDLLVAGNLRTSGGSAVGGSGNGGNGGTVDLYIGNYDQANPALEGSQRIALLKFKVLDSHGGDGNFGGSGGSLDLLADAGYVNPGNLRNEVDLVTRGGSAVAAGAVLPAWGGQGGDVALTSYADPANASNPRASSVSNLGAINAVGGDNREFDGAFWWGGAGGEVQLIGSQGVTNSGSINAGGGRDLGTDGGITGYGGLGNWIVFSSGQGLTNTGALAANGGSGEYQGGDAGEVHLVGQTRVDSRGNIKAIGGNADPALFGSRGGDGGFVQVELAGAGGSFENSASITVTGGNGSLRGSDGWVLSGP